MSVKETKEELLRKVRDLETRLEESEQLIEAIKAGEVDAFAIKNGNHEEVYTLQSGDYAYRMLIEELSEGAINVTEQGLIVYTNAYFTKLLNLPYEAVIGASLCDFIHPASKEKFAELFKSSINGKSKGEVKLAGKDTVIPAYISFTSLQPKLATVGIIVTDLTSQKEHEVVILNYQKELETNNQELINRNQELDSFAYIASHDLQEPLRKIQTFATRLIEKEDKNLSESGKDHFRRMQIAAKKMQTLIEDLLAYSRTNTVRKQFEKISLTQVVEEVKIDLKEELEHKQAIVEVDGLCNAPIIPFQFGQLLHNLMSNSLKFARPKQPPRICIKSETGLGKIFRNSNLKAERLYCHLAFSDNGIGFDGQYSDRIFELFQRLHSERDYSGTGIGLAIVKKIVENHNGFITATSEPDKGATFDIYIPTW